GQDEGLMGLSTTALYRSGTLIDRSDVISSRVVPPSVLLHAADAAGYGVEQDDIVMVEVGGQRLRLWAHVDSVNAVRGLALLRAVSLPSGIAELQILNV